MVIEPKRIEPGWQKRWTEQVLALYRRAAWIPLLIIGLDIWGLYSISLLPGVFLGLFFPFAIFMVIIHYTALRAIDHNADAPLSAIFHYLSSSMHDIYGILKYATAFMLFFTCIGLVVAPVINMINHTELVQHVMAAHPKAHPLSPLFYLVVLAFESVFIVVMLETSLFIVYLTLLIGHNFKANELLARQAIHMNYRILSGAFLSFIMVACMLWLPMFGIRNPFLNWAAIIVLCTLFAILCDFGYMASREMFEGQKENMPKRVTVDTGIHAYSHSR